MSAITKALQNPPANFSTTLSAAIASDALTIPLSSVTGLGTEGVGAIYAKDSLGAVVASSLEFIHWTNISSLNLTLTDTGDRGLNGSASSAQAHNSGDTFEVWVHPEYHFYDWAVVEHAADGTHATTITTDNINEATTNAGVTVESVLLQDGSIRLADTKAIVGTMTGAGGVKTVLALDNDTFYLGNVAAPTIYRGTTHTFWDADGNTVVSNGWFPAGETWTYASADAPTFTFTISGDLTTKYSAGMRIKLTQTTAKYFIITKVAYGSPNTTITVYGGTDYTLANAAITLPFYSTVKAPAGFPLDPLKWQVIAADNGSRSQGTPTANTWYNIYNAQISVPIGAWRLSYRVLTNSYDSAATTMDAYVTLSTAANSESNGNLTAWAAVQGASATQAVNALMTGFDHVLLAAKTTYYLNQKTSITGADALYYRGDIAETRIIALCAYL